MQTILMMITSLKDKGDRESKTEGSNEMKRAQTVCHIAFKEQGFDTTIY